MTWGTEPSSRPHTGLGVPKENGILIYSMPLWRSYGACHPPGEMRKYYVLFVVKEAAGDCCCDLTGNLYLVLVVKKPNQTQNPPINESHYCLNHYLLLRLLSATTTDQEVMNMNVFSTCSACRAVFTQFLLLPPVCTPQQSGRKKPLTKWLLKKRYALCSIHPVHRLKIPQTLNSISASFSSSLHIRSKNWLEIMPQFHLIKLFYQYPNKATASTLGTVPTEDTVATEQVMGRRRRISLWLLKSSLVRVSFLHH